MSEIFSANPIQVFAGHLVGSALLIGLGLLAGIPLLVQHYTSARRLAVGCASVVALVAGLILLGITFYMYTTGAETLNARLSRKRVVEMNASDGNATITTYRLEFGDMIQFDVPQRAYEKMTPGICYQVVYFPQQGLFPIQGETTPTPMQGGAIASIKENSANGCH